jgi:hypothetical protein
LALFLEAVFQPGLLIPFLRFIKTRQGGADDLGRADDVSVDLMPDLVV